MALQDALQSYKDQATFDVLCDFGFTIDDGLASGLLFPADVTIGLLILAAMEPDHGWSSFDDDLDDGWDGCKTWSVNH